MRTRQARRQSFEITVTASTPAKIASCRLRSNGTNPVSVSRYAGYEQVSEGGLGYLRHGLRSFKLAPEQQIPTRSP